MADFRKLLLALIAGALIFGTVAGAADFSCQVAAVPTFIRSEATADLVGDVLLSCGGIVPPLPPGAGLTADITMSFVGQPNVLVTSKKLDARNISEATLVIDRATWANGDRHPKGYANLGTSSTMPVPFQDGSQNIYQAVQLNTQELTWQGVVLIGPGSVVANENVSRSILLTNVRVNAQGMPMNGDVFAQIHITSPTFVPLFGTNPPRVATIRQGLTIVYGLADLLNCDLLPNGTLSFTTAFTEGWGSAFKPRINTTIVTNPPHWVPGGGYFDESGYNPVGFSSGVNGGNGSTGLVNAGGVLDVNSSLVGLSSIGLATQATLLQLKVTGIPAGVTLSSTDTAIVNGLKATLISSTAGTNSMTFIWSVDSFTDVVAQSITNTVTVTVTGSYGAPPVIGVAQAHGRFMPDNADPTLPVPRFVDPSPAGLADVIVINQSCKTMLLFPYLTSSAGYNSGIAISNTSVDPLGATVVAGQIQFPTTAYTATKPQAGACTLYFYGQSNLTALTAAQQAQTIITVPAGGQFVTNLAVGAKGFVYGLDGSKTAACDLDGTPTGNSCPDLPAFVGYMIANCNFQWAHGFAFVTDTGSDRTMGYLALVIPDRGASGGAGFRLPQDNSLGHRPNQGEQLGQ